MRKKEISQAAAMLGRKGGKVRGKSKARTGISERMKEWWASPAAAHRRKKPKPKEKDAKETSSPRTKTTSRSSRKDSGR